MTTEQSTTPDPSPAPEADEKPATPTNRTGFAVYDETYLRYVGGVHDTKAKAAKAAKDAKVKNARIDEV